MHIKLVFIILISFSSFNIYQIKNSLIYFTSDAPLEVVKAYSRSLEGKIDSSNNNFNFKVSMQSFEGFNTGLQKIHFNESFMESSKFPTATFDGIILEKIDYNTTGITNVTAKGTLKVHGVKSQKTIKGTLEIKENKIIINAAFKVKIADFNIKIPPVIKDKIATVIDVKLKAELEE